MDSLKKITATLIPFLTVGVAIVLFVAGIILLSYILLYGVILGLILFVISYIYMKLTRCRHNLSDKKSEKLHSKGRIIDHDPDRH